MAVNTSKKLGRTMNSFVVFDLESTGLPSPGDRPRITELCLIAISRGELLSKYRQQRVFNKLHLCLDPCKKIHHKSSEITGLHNDALAEQASFKEQASLVCSFLQNLPQPACLIAHNGHRFDFPLLKSELNNAQKCLPSDVCCADSLEAFRTFDGLPPVPDFVLQRESEKKLNKASSNHKKMHAEDSTTQQNTSSNMSSLNQSSPSSGLHDENNASKFNVTFDTGVNGNDATINERVCEKRSSPFCENKVSSSAKIIKNTDSPPHPVDITPDQKIRNSTYIKINDKSIMGSEPFNSQNVDHVRKRLFETTTNLVNESIENKLNDKVVKNGNQCDASVEQESKSEFSCHKEINVVEEEQIHPELSSQNSTTDLDLLQAYEHFETSMTEIKDCNDSSLGSDNIRKVEVDKDSKTENTENKNINTSINKTNKNNISTKKVKKSYALGKLYSFHFGQTAEVLHTAEDDCQVLLKLINLHKDKFVKFCDDNALLFSEVESMY